MITINEDKRPKVVCPNCKDEILMDILPFRDNVSQIMSDKCPKCRGDIYVGLIILCHSDMRSLIKTIQKIIDVSNPKQRIIGNIRS